MSQADSSPSRPTAAVLTLGCKVNQFESAAMSRLLTEAGYEMIPAGPAADLTVINTCSVTHRADFETRALIRRAFRRNPEGRIVVAGCLAQLRPEELADLPGVALVLGRNKNDLVRLLRQPDPDKIMVAPPGVYPEPAALGFPDFDRTRAFLRIQDGCSAHCAYCVVPRARGPSRSLPEALVREGLSYYQTQGRREVVLTGIHLGAWGLDLLPAADLTGLLARLEALGPEPRLRLSSIEPNEATPLLLSLVASSPRLCPHLHLPLQSGSDRILEAMRRPYTAATIKAIVETVNQVRDDFCLGVDVMVGFPSEEEPDFDRTRRLLRELPLAYFHVFPYSRRPGTPAAARPGQVPEREKTRRVEILRRLGQEKRLDFHRRCLGQVRPTLIENTRDKATGLTRGLTDNYIQILITGPPPPAGRIMPIKLTEIDGQGRVSGRPV
ncbi:MAG: tRNA (N(6)-L-threonylcarbamoyladenosine(37)-C(2))-methylthiotransferase MtaB [Thermodesulfobacteriota bacterium]